MASERLSLSPAAVPGGGSGGSVSPTPRRGAGCGSAVSSMQIRAKFGQLGQLKGQFNSPHGFCLGTDEEIIVADTNNHRIQVRCGLSGHASIQQKRD